jgi:hypothetical protein
MLCFGLGKRNRMIAGRRIVRALAGRRVLVWVHYEDLRGVGVLGAGLGEPCFASLVVDRTGCGWVVL